MPRPGYDDVILVTGYPSFYAKRMVEHVLRKEPRALVHVVVLKKFEAEARAELDALGPADRARVVPFEGDVAAMDLGLSGAEFRQLARDVDRIHHVAHASYVGVDRATARQLNVVGTAEVLALAQASTALRCLVLHSTALVAGDRRGVVYEDELEAGQGFRNAVEETRMQAERLARRAMKEVPIAVVRPTTLVGDSSTGETGRLDGPYLLVLLILATPADIALPLPGRGDGPLNIVPIDYVVAAAHAIGLHPSARGKTFHLTDPRALPAREVFDLIARAGGRRATRGYIPSNVAKAILRTPGIERFVRSPRDFVDQLTSAVRFDTRNTDQVLAGTGIACPPFESYVEQLVAMVQERMRTRKERRDDVEGEVDDPLS